MRASNWPLGARGMTGAVVDDNSSTRRLRRNIQRTSSAPGYIPASARMGPQSPPVIRLLWEAYSSSPGRVRNKKGGRKLWWPPGHHFQWSQEIGGEGEASEDGVPITASSSAIPDYKSIKPPRVTEAWVRVPWGAEEMEPTRHLARENRIPTGWRGGWEGPGGRKCLWLSKDYQASWPRIPEWPWD